MIIFKYHIVASVAIVVCRCFEDEDYSRSLKRLVIILLVHIAARCLPCFLLIMLPLVARVSGPSVRVRAEMSNYVEHVIHAEIRTHRNYWEMSKKLSVPHPPRLKVEG